MKKILQFLIPLCCIFFLAPVTSATDVGGLINFNTTWTLSNSPYIVTSSILVNTGVKLTIEAGVNVKFNSGLNLSVDGTLIARGTPGSMIRFTSSKSTPAKGDWTGVNFSNNSIDAVYSGNVYQSGCILEYCIIEYAGPAVKVVQSAPCIDHNIIQNNYTNGSQESAGIEIGTGNGIKIRNNLFLSNHCRNISRAGGALEMSSSNNVSIINNIFYNNYGEIYNGGGGGCGGAINLNNAGTGPYYIAYNTFFKNLADGYQNSSLPQQVAGAFLGENFASNIVTMEFNTIVENSAVESQNPGAVVSYRMTANNNNIYNNTPYDVAIHAGYSKTTGYELDATNNWWGTATESEIQAHIYDFYDKFDENEVLYNPWKTSHVINAPVSPPTQVIKQEKPGGIYLRWNANPESDIDGYRIYYGNPTGYSYTSSVDAGNVTEYTLAGVSLSDEIAVTAYDITANGTDDISEGYESWYSISKEGLSISLSGTNVSCKGLADGAVDLTVSNGFAPFTYNWSNSATSRNIVNLSAGTYYITVTDAKNFTASDMIVITEPDLLQIILNGTNINCNGGNDGSVNLTVTGGTPAYSCSWTGPESYTASREDISELIEGKYYIQVTDNKSCSANDSITLTYNHELPTPVITFPDSNKICNGDTLKLDAGAGYTSYSWSTGKSTRTIKVTLPNTYVVTVTDVFGCINSGNETVTVFPVPTSLFVLEESMCDNEQNVITYAGSGIPGATYNWGLDGGSIVSGSGQGPLTVGWPSTGSKTISLYVVQNGCYSDTTESILNVYPVPTSTFTIQKAVCSDGVVPVTYTGTASTGAEYNWIFDGGVIQSGSGQGPVEVNWATGSNKSVTLQVSENGCHSGITEHSIYVAYPYRDEEICIATVDVETGKNMIIWEKTPDAGIAFYNIYRESNVAGVYDSIGNVPYENLSLFIDMKAVPEQQQYLYKISAIDTCGNESGLSQYHKTLFLQYNGADVGVNLSWKLYQIEGTPVSFQSYILYKGTDSTTLQPFDTISGALDAYTDRDPAVLQYRHYYRIAGVKSTECSPTGIFKAGTGPYSQSMSNLEDNRLQTGIIKPPFAAGMTIFPNPFNERTTLRFPNPENKVYRLTVRDLSGKVVRAPEKITGNEFVLERGVLKPGYYFVELSGKEMFYGKIIIE